MVRRPARGRRRWACRAVRRATAGRSAGGWRGGDVVLAQVAVQPVGEVQEAVVHRDEQVGDQAGHAARQRPAVESTFSTAITVSAVNEPLSRWKCHIVLDRAAPTKPLSASGSCSQRTSNGRSPVSRSSSVCSTRRSAGSRSAAGCRSAPRRRRRCRSPSRRRWARRTPMRRGRSGAADTRSRS